MRRFAILLLLLAASAQGAINAGTVWECRSTGNLANGGGYYNRDPGTSVDYSQQDAAQLSLTDLACVTTTTTLTSATGGFTAAMAGNVIKITSGTNFIAGWYEITAYTNTNTVTLDRTPVTGSNGSSGAGKVGGGIALGSDTIDNEFWVQVVAGNTIYVTGTWTFSESVNASASDGTNVLPIKLIGYKTTRATTPYLADRPDWTQGAFYFLPGDYWIVQNIHAIGSGASGVLACSGDGPVISNCQVLNNSGTAGRSALGTGAYAIVRHCDIASTNGTAVLPSAAALRLGLSRIHDSAVGVGPYAQLVVVGNVFYNVATPIAQGTTSLLCVYGNTFNTGTTAISGNVVSVWAENNIIDNYSTAEVNWTTNYVGCWANNCWGEASPTLTNISNALGPGNLSSDPGLVDPAGGNFTVPIGSVVLDAGSQVDTNLGLVGDYKWNIGADQGDHAAAGGGSSEKPFNPGLY